MESCIGSTEACQTEDNHRYSSVTEQSRMPKAPKPKPSTSKQKHMGLWYIAVLEINRLKGRLFRPGVGNNWVAI